MHRFKGGSSLMKFLEDGGINDLNRVSGCKCESRFDRLLTVNFMYFVPPLVA